MTETETETEKDRERWRKIQREAEREFQMQKHHNIDGRVEVSSGLAMTGKILLFSALLWLLCPAVACPDLA